MSASFDLEILVRTVYGEARGESAEGKLAVAHAILNRWKSGKWFAGATLASTCLKKWQFSCWNTDDPNREKMCDASEADLAECGIAAADAISGRKEDPTLGATHYHAAGMQPFPPWARGRVGLTIGNHIFYGDVP